MRWLRTARLILLGISVLLVGMLVVRAVDDEARLPRPFHEFGNPASWPSVAIVVAVLAALCIVSYLVRRNPASATAPVAIVGGLGLVGFVLALASYWRCSDQGHPTFFTGLVWTAALVMGGMDDKFNPEICAADYPPVAIDVARLAILAAFALGVIGVAAAAFRLQADRMRIGWATAASVVVDADEDAESMVNALARRSAYRGSLVLLTSTPGSSTAQQSRTKGARVLAADFTRPATVGTNRLWRRIDRLYLLAPDPSTNLAHLQVIGDRLAEVGNRRRIPLIVRIDDPWLAKAWRAGQFGGSDTRWAADAVGTNEVTARVLLDQIIDIGTVERVFVCGRSQLTLALCADMARRQIEQDFHPLDPDATLPRLVLVDPGAEDYRDELKFHEERRGFGTSRTEIDVIAQEPTVALLTDLVTEDAARSAVIFVDTPWEPTTASRLAARYAKLPIFVWDPKASVVADSVPVVGQLRKYRLGIDLPEGQAHDNFERAAELIHERYSSTTDRDTPATVPWAQLSEFYKESNRRLVYHALQMVEQIAGHTWNTWALPQDELSVADLTAREGDPIEQLRLLGFSDDAVHAMAQAEFEDWSRYYRDNGWQHGSERDFEKKKHEKLVDSWAETLADERLRKAAFASLATTLIQLRLLGYRSAPLWKPYARTGSVTARRRWLPWTWPTEDGETMRARPGDWKVSDDGRHHWSVRNDIFRRSYRRDHGDRWNASGVVLAREAVAGEVIETLEGRTHPGPDAVVVQGYLGEQWAQPREKFEQRYRPASFTERFQFLRNATGAP